MASMEKLNPPHQVFHSPARQPELAQTVMPLLQESGGTQELVRSLCSEMAHYHFCHLLLGWGNGFWLLMGVAAKSHCKVHGYEER